MSDRLIHDPYRIEDRTRQETYQNEIEEMKNRVEQSPLLVDKYLAVSSIIQLYHSDLLKMIVKIFNS